MSDSQLFTIERRTPGDHTAWNAIERIFFMSAAGPKLADKEARRRFFRRWTDYYRYEEPEGVLLCRLADRRVAGYLTGCLDSRGAGPLYRSISSYGLFDSYFEQFPAHFHVNCHPAHRGQGFGSILVRAFLEICRVAKLPGAHVVTASDARNVSFYRRLGFAPLEERDFEGIRRLLLGLRFD